MIATYHNHTTWSDGKASIAELIAAAERMEIEELGISDHWVLHPHGTQFKWAMQTDRLPDYVAEINALKKIAKPPAAADLRQVASVRNASGLQLRLGLEVDWHPPEFAPGQAGRLRDVLEQYPFDYIIGSVHEIQQPWSPGQPFMIDGSPSAWQPLSPEQINQIHRQYWKNMRSLAESGVFDIVAHMDLPKKFAFHATTDLSNEIHAALDAIAAAVTPTGGRLVVEVNTAGWHKPCAEAYPTLDILRDCRRREIPTTINADAHHPEHLLRDFERAAARLAEAGYTQIARFAEREVRFEPLEHVAKPQAA